MLIHFTPRNFAEKCCLKLVILGADHLTFGGGEGGIGDLGKKYPADWFQGEKNLARKYLGEKIPALKKISLIVYNTGKKSLTLLYVREEILSPEVWGKHSYPNQITHTPPPPPTKVKWSAPELFFFIFCSVCLIVLIYGLKDPFPLHKYLTQRQSCSWQYNNSYCWHQRWYKRGGSICMGCYGWFIVLVG